MDVITDIRHERGKFHITINGSEKVVVPAPLFRERPLSEGEPIDLEEYDHWLMVRQYRAALDRAVALLASRARSRREVKTRLLQSGYRPCTVEMVLYKLKRERLLDDGDFARQWVEARVNRKLGRNRIARELRDKGVSAEEAEAALTAIDEDDQLEAAVQLAKKLLCHARQDEPSAKTAQRVVAMLLRRGYGYGLARQALEKAAAAPEE